MKVKAKLNNKGISYVDKLLTQSLVETADATLSDLKRSQTMPFDTGEMQDRDTYIDDSKKNSGKVSIVTDTVKARRLYFHPEYNFKQDKNANAGGEWFEPYINGNKKDFIPKSFAKIMRGKL